MAQLTLELPDDVAARLARVAAAKNKNIEEIVLEQLAAVPEPTEEDRPERYEEFIRESGLFIEVPEAVKRRYQPVSEERLRELAEKLGAAGPLSEVIIEERGKR